MTGDDDGHWLGELLPAIVAATVLAGTALAGPAVAVAVVGVLVAAMVIAARGRPVGRQP